MHIEIKQLLHHRTLDIGVASRDFGCELLAGLHNDEVFGFSPCTHSISSVAVTLSGITGASGVAGGLASFGAMWAYATRDVRLAVRGGCTR